MHKRKLSMALILVIVCILCSYTKTSAVHITSNDERVFFHRYRKVIPSRGSIPSRGKKVIANLSAYTASVKECGNSRGITASGAKVKEWETIAAPDKYPYGTKIYIPFFKDKPNKGIFVVTDRGGAIKGNHFDIYMEELEDANNFGRQRNAEIYILEGDYK